MELRPFTEESVRLTTWLSESKLQAPESIMAFTKVFPDQNTLVNLKTFPIYKAGTFQARTHETVRSLNIKIYGVKI